MNDELVTVTDLEHEGCWRAAQSLAKPRGGALPFGIRSESYPKIKNFTNSLTSKCDQENNESFYSQIGRCLWIQNF